MADVKRYLGSASHFLLAIVIASLIAYFNFQLIRNWFAGEFNQNISSIEISYIQMAKFWVEGGGSWQPLWYLGYPWHVFYTPILPFFEVLAQNLLDFSFAHAYRVITGAGFVLVPVATFLFVWQISRSKTGAAIAALFYSFVPSVIAFLFGGVAADTLSGHLEPRRFAILVRWGEGPHTLALVFLPIYGFFLSRYLEKSKFRDLLLTSVFLGLVALTNAIVVWAAILLTFAFFLAEASRKGSNLLSTVGHLIKLAVVTFGLISFWYNLQFLGTFFREGSGALSNWQALFPWGIIVLGLAAILIFLAVKKILAAAPEIALALYWFLFMFGIVYVYYASGENRLEYVPQALRFNTEVDLALAILVGTVVSWIFLALSSFVRLPKYVAKVVALLVFALVTLPLLWWGLALASRLPEYTRDLSANGVAKIENTAEYRVAKKLNELVSDSDQRVLAPGNYGFWLNFFAPVPQLRGALFQSSTHSWPDHIYYQLANGTDARISLAWLKIANIGKFVYTTAGSGETYHDFKVPQSKFDSILTKQLEENGDIYYDVPLKNDNLAKVVDWQKHLEIKKPINAIDEEPILAYVDSLEGKAEKKLDVTRLSASRLKISGETSDGEGILVQQTYDPGWKVRKISGDGGWRIKKDSFDFIVLVPKGAPPSGGASQFELELIYRKHLVVWLGYLVTAATLAWVGNRTYKTYRSYKSNL